MSFIFNSVADSATLMILIVFCFCDVLSGSVFQLEWSKSEWYLTRAKRTRIIPPGWVFPLVWTILYVLIVTSLYIFYRSVTMTGAYGHTFDTITILFIVNIVLNKLWSPVFFRMHSPMIAWFFCLGILGTGIAILYYFGANNYGDSCWIFLPYVVWTAFALLLNTVWIFRNRSVTSESPMVEESPTILKDSPNNIQEEERLYEL